MFQLTGYSWLQRPLCRNAEGDEHWWRLPERIAECGLSLKSAAEISENEQGQVCRDTQWEGELTGWCIGEGRAAGHF